jgi:hypothetical protein
LILIHFEAFFSEYVSEVWHSVHMPDENTPTLQDIAADRDWWNSTCTRYRELADWLREIADKCCLPNAQHDLLKLARTYERRAEKMERRHGVDLMV